MLTVRNGGWLYDYPDINVMSQEIIEKIESLLEKAQKIAISEVERLARKCLEENKHLNEFVMAMGTYFFTLRNGEICHETEYEPLENLIAKFDEQFSLTGHSMRFTADSEIVTQW